MQKRPGLMLPLAVTPEALDAASSTTSWRLPVCEPLMTSLAAGALSVTAAEASCGVAGLAL